MARKFTPEQTLKLVTLYRDHECLWNCNCNDYKKPHMKRQALHDMCFQLNIQNFTVADLKLKIKIIRSTYCIELDKIRKSIGTDHVYKPRVIWFDVLDSFIRDFTMKKRRNNDAETLDYSILDNESFDTQHIQYQHEESFFREDKHILQYKEQDSLSQAAFEIIVDKNSEFSKRKIYQLDGSTNAKLVRDGEDDLDPVLTIPKLNRPSQVDHTYHINPDHTYDTPQTLPQAMDEFETFGKHVASQLRKLSSIKYVLAQEEIQSVLTKFRMQDINDMGQL